MQLDRIQLSPEALTAIGAEARLMLLEKRFAELVDQFGYALAFDRSPAAALEADFLIAASTSRKVLADSRPTISVGFFKPNDTGLLAVVNCPVVLADDTEVVLDLIVTGNEFERFITIEDISGVAA